MNPQLNAWIDTIGWALIHFVWQGGLIALATAAARFVSPPLAGDALRDRVRGARGHARRAGHHGCSRRDNGPDHRVGGSASPTVSTSASPSPALPTARLQTASLSLAATAARTASTVERWLPIVVVVWLSGAGTSLGAIRWRVVPSAAASCLAQEPLSPWQCTVSAWRLSFASTSAFASSNPRSSTRQA